MTIIPPAVDEQLALRNPLGESDTQRSRKRRRSTGAGYIFLTVAALLTLFPLIWTVFGAFKPSTEILTVPPTLLPQSPTVQNFIDLVAGDHFYRYFLNSVVVAAISIAGNILLCTMVGYALAKLSFPGKRLVFIAVLLAIMVPAIVMFVPLFVTVNALGMSNSYAGMTVPFIVGATGVFLVRQFLLDVPDELLEAARIDGASEMYIFRRVVLPLCGPVVATIGILTFMGSWNSLLWPLVIAQSQEMYTLPVALAFLSQGDGVISYGVTLVGSLLTILPILLVFLFFQRYFIAGVATSGLK